MPCLHRAATLLALLGTLSPGIMSGQDVRSLLGRPLTPTPLPAATREAYETRLAEARRAWEHTPDDADSIIWLGRRTAYLGRLREAISIYEEGIRRHPDDPRLYRHRGHRYLTVRELDHAILDLEKARTLVAGRPDQVEPDGIPNARGIPTSTLQSNIRYHLGLARYLKGDFSAAARIFGEDVAAARAAGNADMLVASTHWLYMALRRAGRTSEARAALAPIRADLPVIENGAYQRLALMYKGEIPPDSLTPAAFSSVEDVTLGYGVANWHYYSGKRERGVALFCAILESPQWGAFGYLAAEAEVARIRGGCGQRLGDVRVRATTPCEIHPETAAETAELWLDANRALESVVEGAGPAPLLLLANWKRTLTPDLRLRFERRDTIRQASRHPFEKPAPGNLERMGYIQRRADGHIFYGPDAGLILSERFLRRHCFARLAGSGGATGLAGLRFDPLPTTELPDVTGVLWIDPRTHELRHVEYTWTNAPEEARGPAAGGRTEFARLVSGEWMIRRWNIRMPRYGAGVRPGGDGYTEQGGEVVAVGAVTRKGGTP